MCTKRNLLYFALCAVFAATTGVAGQQNFPGKSQSPERTIEGKPGANGSTKTPSNTDTQFLKDAAVDNAAEIQFGQMAEQKAASPKVKSFGQRMVKDHSAADDLLMQVAAGLNVTLPNSLDQKHQSEKQELQGLSGKKFDHAYMLMMVKAHTKAVQKFEQESKQAQNPTVKSFAKKSVPMLKSHLKEAKQIEAEMKQGK